MKLFTGWLMSAGLVLTATAANAQMPAPYDIATTPYTRVSDVAGPYAAMPQEAAPPYEPGYGRYEPGYGPMLMPPSEVYAILGDNGFSPLGAPHQRGPFYTIAVIDRRGDDGRLVIDARTGRIIRFMPANRMGDNYNDEPPAVIYGPPPGPLRPMPPVSSLRDPPRPPAPVPRVASRTPVPLPKAPPPHAVEVKPELKSETKPETKPLAAKPAPEPAQQSAAVQAAPTDVPTKPPPAVPIVEAKPTPPIQPTQPMPKAQGLD